MATVDVVTEQNKSAGQVELSATVFGAPVRPHLFHAEVRRQLAKRHRGTHSTKNRSAVSGGGAKPYRQKGTGRARQGTTRAPQWSGGGSVFGPVPRSHEHGLPKKARRAALCGVLSQRLAEGAIKVVESIEIGEYKTRRVTEILEGLGLGSHRVLMVIAERDDFVERSSRNLPGVKVLRVAGLNVYDVLRHEKMVVTKDALAGIEARLAGGKKETAA